MGLIDVNKATDMPRFNSSQDACSHFELCVSGENEWALDKAAAKKSCGKLIATNWARLHGFE